MGIFQSIHWNHFGPKGIFMGMAGLPSGLMLGFGYFFSSASP